MSKTADVVIIGGGVIGTSIAYYLARKNIRAILVEKGSPGSGTTSASSGTVALQTKTLGTKLELARESFALFHQLTEETEMDFEFECGGSLMVALTQEENILMTERANKLERAGVPVEILDSRAARDLQPGLTAHNAGGVFCPSDCSINPLLLVGAYQKAAKKLGSEFLYYTEVTDIEVKNGTVKRIMTKTGRIDTPIVVNAAGVWSKAISKMADTLLPIVPRKGEILVTEATDPLLKGELLSASYLLSKKAPEISVNDWIAEDLPKTTIQVGIAANQTRRGNLLIGSTREFVGFDTRSSLPGIRELVRQIITLMPATAELNIIRTYSGLRPSTPDGLPIVEKSIDVSGLFTAAGHEGDGIALSPITGMLMAGLITGEEAQNPLLPKLSAARFTSLN